MGAVSSIDGEAEEDGFIAQLTLGLRLEFAYHRLEVVVHDVERDLETGRAVREAGNQGSSGKS